MRKIKVTYYSIDKPNKNNHLYTKDLLEASLVKFCKQDFWVVRSPAEGIDLTDIIGKVYKAVWNENSLSFYINLYREEVDISKDYFCLFGLGDVCLADFNDSVTKVNNFDITGMFIADSCAWEYKVELLEDVE